jgi:membrane protein DedA with SNARE-associated domain
MSRSGAVTKLAEMLSHLTNAVADHGAIAVFVLMAVDALLPVGGELVMLLAGALAAGAIGHATGGAGTYVTLALAGTLGYLLGAVAGWWLGARGGRPLIERRGRWLHLPPERLARAERWFARFGPAAVFLGRLTPVVRSFISIPAGIFGTPFGRYVALTLAGSAIWCFGFAAVGWVAGGSYDSVHHAFRYADVAVVLGLVVAAALVSSAALRRSRA